MDKSSSLVKWGDRKQHCSVEIKSRLNKKCNLEDVEVCKFEGSHKRKKEVASKMYALDEEQDEIELSALRSSQTRKHVYPSSLVRTDVRMHMEEGKV